MLSISIQPTECFLFVYFHYDRDDVPAGQQKIILVDISAQDISADRLLNEARLSRAKYHIGRQDLDEAF